MDPWLKWLIAAACCVVIAGGGYFGWSEYQRHVAVQRAIQAERELAAIKDAQTQKEREQSAEWLRSQELLNLRSRCHGMANELRAYKTLEQPKGVRAKNVLIREIQGCAKDDNLSADDLADMKEFL